MTKDTHGLTRQWAFDMEENGFVTTDQIADLMDEVSHAQEALFEKGSPVLMCDIVKRYHESEIGYGPNFRTLFGALLVFAREVDPDLEESILNMLSHGLSAYTEATREKWVQADVNEYTQNAFLRLYEASVQGAASRAFDLEF